MNPMIHVAIVLLQIGLTAWINIKIKFAQSEQDATRLIRTGLLKLSILAANLLGIAYLVAFTLSPVPALRWEIGMFGVFILLVSLRFSLMRSLELASGQRQQSDILHSLAMLIKPSRKASAKKKEPLQ